jgi:hypothetical protein
VGFILKKTRVTIEGSKFKINGEYTYKSRQWKGIDIEGLLFNTRMVQGVFDDKNPKTAVKWAYPDTGLWDPERNVSEFIENMKEWKEHGVLAFTLNLQGGSPEGYSKEQPWVNTAFFSDGTLDTDFMNRLERILERADELGMVVILGYFYFGQAKRLKDENAVRTAIDNATRWVLEKGYENVIIEINNECDINNIALQHGQIAYIHDNLIDTGVHESIQQVQDIEVEGRRLLVGTSFRGDGIPGDNVVKVSDFILIHGNGVEENCRIEEMVNIVKSKACYQGQPILFNEDDHFDFDKEYNHMIAAIKNGASWGYFDPGISNYCDGYQCPPVNWGINTALKRAFFSKVKEITGV